MSIALYEQMTNEIARWRALALCSLGMAILGFGLFLGAMTKADSMAADTLSIPTAAQFAVQPVDAAAAAAAEEPPTPAYTGYAEVFDFGK